MNKLRKAIGSTVGKGIGILLVLLMGAGNVDAVAYLNSMVSSPSGTISFCGYVTDGVTTILGHQIEASEASYTGFLASLNPDSEDIYVEQTSFIPSNLEFDGDGNLYVYGGRNLAKYSPDNEIIWVQQLEDYLYNNHNQEEWTVKVVDMEPKPDGSMDLLVTAHTRDGSHDDVWEVYTTGEGPARFLLNIWATYPITIDVHSKHSDVQIFLFGRHENLTLNGVDGTNVSIVIPEYNTYLEMKQEYNYSSGGSGSGYDYSAPSGLSDGEVGIFTPGVGITDSQLLVMNMGANGTINWTKEVSTQKLSWPGSFFGGTSPMLLKTGSQESSVFIPFRNSQFFIGDITLGDGTLLNPDPHTEDSLSYVIRLDESGNLIGYEDFLGKAGPLESLPVNFLTGDEIERRIGYNGEHYLWESNSRTNHNVLVLNKDLEVQTTVTDITKKALKAAFDVEVSKNELGQYKIASVVGSGSEFLVVLYSTAWKHAGTGPLGEFHKYQLFVRFAPDGTLIDAIPLQMPVPLNHTHAFEFRIVADANGNYTYLQSDRNAIDDQVHLDEYSIEPIGEFIRYLSKNRGPFTGLKTVAGSWRQHWMFGWVSETVHPNWWFSLDAAGYIFVPPSSSDLDFLYYLNDKGWYWTNYELYPYVYSFELAEWIVVRSSQPL